MTRPGPTAGEAGLVGVATLCVVAFAAAFTVAVPLLLVGGAAAWTQGAGIADSPPSAVALSQIPPYLLPHYESAPACTGLPWQIVAAIGWVESRHGEGRVDPTTGNTAPPIIGPALNGTDGNEALPATAASTAWTGDPVWQHAIGPMQFLAGTFAAWATSGSGTGPPNPNNAYDAIATAGRFLCNGQPTLDSVSAAILRYNNSPTYEADVINQAIAYGMTTAGSSPGGGATFTSSGGTTVAGDVNTVIDFALAQLGKPYQWGATGPNSYDCSGLTQASYAAAGIHIDRVTSQQATDGVAVAWQTSPIEPGDLILMPDGSGVADGHVGLALDATHMIQAPYTGTDVQISPIPFSIIDTVRRIITPPAS